MLYVVPRAGHVQAGPDHHIRRQHFPGHELIFCIGGSGWLRMAGNRHQIGRGNLVWVDCRHPHEYGADSHDPWEVYWVRTDGPGLARLADHLGVAASPVAANTSVALAVELYESVFAEMDMTDAGAAARLHALVARLLSAAVQGRSAARTRPDPVCPPELLPALQHIRLSYFEPTSVPELARRCGMSASHFGRLFRSAFGCGPNTFLRRERINHAKRRLVESADAIKQIAEQVGYGDHYFFSRDFKQMVGITPRGYRRQERGHEQVLP
jgi:AraC-like DNA-binding protein